jgi:hypothetical protein
VRYYFDTSALCRYYHAEAGSDVVVAQKEGLSVVNPLTS